MSGPSHTPKRGSFIQSIESELVAIEKLLPELMAAHTDEEKEILQKFSHEFDEIKKLLHPAFTAKSPA